MDTRMDDMQHLSSPKSKMLSSYWSRCMCCVLETNLTRKFVTDLSLQIFLIHYISGYGYSPTHVYVNRKTRIKCAKNRMQLQIKKIVHIKKLHIHAQLWDINLISRNEVVLLFYYCWWFIVLKNRLQFNSTKILHGYQWQANLFVAITVQTDLLKMLLPMWLHNQNK